MLSQKISAFNGWGTDYKKGLKAGTAIGIGYISVSFAFGMLAVTGGLSPFAAVIISMTNLTSAGQFAGIGLIFNSSAYIEIFLTMLVINSRYFLMSFSLTQKLERRMSSFQKAIIAFGITDEVFAVASLEKEELSYAFMLGLMTCPYIGWALGTYIGAETTMLLTPSMQDALGIALYAMFIALIMPAAKASLPILITVLVAVVASCVFKYVPYLRNISFGFVIIIVTVIASGISAYLFPIKEEI